MKKKTDFNGAIGAENTRGVELNRRRTRAQKAYKLSRWELGASVAHISYAEVHIDPRVRQR